MEQTLVHPNYHTNAVKIIKLHKKYGTWMFNDEYLGLVDESFVLGATEVIQTMIDNIPSLTNKKTPTILFGENIPEYHGKITLTEDLGTNAYYEFEAPNGEKMKLWLCNVLSMFFNPLPKQIFVLFQN